MFAGRYSLALLNGNHEGSKELGLRLLDFRLS